MQPSVEVDRDKRQCSNTAFMEVVHCFMCLVSGAAALFSPLLLNAIFQTQRVTSINCVYKTTLFSIAKY